MALPLLIAAAIGLTALITGCDSEEEVEGLDYNCPALDQFPPNQKIDYKDLSFYSTAGFQTWPGENVELFVDKVSKRAEDFEGEFRFFKALDQVIHEAGHIPSPKPEEINELINTRSANSILSGELSDDAGRLIYSGCHDIAIVVRSVLIQLGYNVVFVDSVKRDFLEGGANSGHTFLEVHDPVYHKLFLYDPTAGKIYGRYDPNNYTLPGGYMVFAKSLDPWTMSIANVDQLSVCLNRYRDEFYNTSAETSFQEIFYKEIDLN